MKKNLKTLNNSKVEPVEGLAKFKRVEILYADVAKNIYHILLYIPISKQNIKVKCPKEQIKLAVKLLQRKINQNKNNNFLKVCLDHYKKKI